MAKKSKLPVEKLGASKPVPVKIVNDAPTTSSKSDRDYEERERKYRAEDALRTMQRVEEIKKDKTLMADMKKLARQNMDALKKIC